MTSTSTATTCDQIAPDTVRLAKRYKARRERVWAAWTEPERFCKWFGSHGWTCTGVDFDNREGGERTMHMANPEGKAVRVFGAYQEFTPPERMVFTWSAEGEGYDISDSLVTIEFIEHADGTELRITHSGLSTPEYLESHRDGWIANLDLVATYLGKSE